MIAAVLTGIIGISTAKISQASINTMLSTKTAIQAQQYAEAESFIIKNTSYSDLVGHSKTNIPADGSFKSEVVLSEESDYNDKVKQRTATINIYKDDEANPRFTLKQIAYSIAQNNSGVPIGTIITWASKNLPKDGIWLECNGQSCAAYPELVNILGSNTVPDYRGMFLRGYGSQNSSSSYGTTTHSSAALGTLQLDSIRNIQGTIDLLRRCYNVGDRHSGVLNYSQHWNAGIKTGNGDDWGSLVEFNASWTVPTANENRPVNKAVLYLIKAN